MLAQPGRAMPAALALQAARDRQRRKGRGRPQQDRRRERERRDPSKAQQQAAGQQGGAGPGAAPDGLGALRTARDRLGIEQVGVEGAIGLVRHEVREEEHRGGQRDRGEPVHEPHGHERHGHDRGRREQKGQPAPQARPELIGPRPDDEGHPQRHDALAADNGADRGGGRRELPHDRRQIGRDDRDRQRQPERRKSEQDQAAPLGSAELAPALLWLPDPRHTSPRAWYCAIALSSSSAWAKACGRLPRSWRWVTSNSSLKSAGGPHPERLRSNQRAAATWSRC